jgi:hypothetical protein
MTLAEFQAKYAAMLLSAPMFAADLADLVQDERADEREQCAGVADSVDTCYHNTAKWIASNIRQRNTKESN